MTAPRSPGQDLALLKQMRRVSADPAYSPTRHVEGAGRPAAPIPPARTCQFPVSTQGRRHVLCEAVPVVPGRPYCLPHVQVAYQPARVRDRVDERIARTSRPHMLGPARLRRTGVEHVAQDD